jgi:hypothetical protein
MRIPLLVLISTIVIPCAKAQFNEVIRTGRPGQAIGAFTVGAGIFQVQSGFDYYGLNEKNSDRTMNGFSNNTVLRYGLTEPFEISALLDYRTQTLTENSTEEKTSGLSALDLGMRYHIYTGKGLIPNIGFQFRLRLPVLSEDYKIDDIAPRFIVVTSQQLSKTFTLITNWGAAWNGNSSSPTGTYVINLAFPFNDKLGAFVETFGVYGRGDFFINFDTGLAWLITPDLQLDIYGGYGSNYGVNDYFMSTGISWRTKKRQ